MLAHLKAGPHTIFCHFPTNSIFFLCFRWKSVFLAIGSCQSKLVYTQKLVSSLRGISNFDSNYIIHTLFQQYCVCDVWQVSDAPKPRRSTLITQYCCSPQVVDQLLWVSSQSLKIHLRNLFSSQKVKEKWCASTSKLVEIHNSQLSISISFGIFVAEFKNFIYIYWNPQFFPNFLKRKIIEKQSKTISARKWIAD